MNIQNNENGKIRTVSVNERGQIVIPEDIREDLGIKGQTTLVMIEREGEIVICKESHVLRSLSEEKFWKAVSRKGMMSAWEEEDKIWDKYAKEDLNG